MSRRLPSIGVSLAVLLAALTGFDRAAAKPPDLPIVENDVLTAPPVAAQECETPAPSGEIPSLFQMRPSVRRTVASCFLFGVHPLLALAPTEDYLEVDDEAMPAKVGGASTSSPDAPSTCPYLRQQQCVPDRQTVMFADPDFSRDVLQNLEALRKSRELVEKAGKLSREGRTLEALDALRTAAELCPGGRFDEEIRATAAQLFANESDAQREIEQKLLKPVTFHYTNVPLRQVIDDLHAWVDVNTYVDASALDAQEISLDRLVSIHLENVALKSALTLVLKHLHLTYVVRDDVIEITTEQSRRAEIEPSLPPLDAGVPTALDQLFSQTLELSQAAAGFASEEQEAPAVSSPRAAMEFGFGWDGGFRLFTRFPDTSAVWHLEYNQNGLKWWASPDGGAGDNAPRCTGFNLDAATSPSEQ